MWVKLKFIQEQTKVNLSKVMILRRKNPLNLPK